MLLGCRVLFREPLRGGGRLLLVFLDDFDLPDPGRPPGLSLLSSSFGGFRGGRLRLRPL